MKNATAPVAPIPLKVSELVQLIAGSALPEGKKLAYLYMIADESFSLSHFDGLLRDMEAAGEGLERRRAVISAQLEALKHKRDQKQTELGLLQIEAAHAKEMRVEKFLHLAEKQAEAAKKQRDSAVVKRIKKTFRKP